VDYKLWSILIGEKQNSLENASDYYMFFINDIPIPETGQHLCLYYDDYNGNSNNNSDCYKDYYANYR